MEPAAPSFSKSCRQLNATGAVPCPKVLERKRCERKDNIVFHSSEYHIDDVSKLVFDE